MPVCPTCSASVAGGAVFCAHCGARLKDAAPTAQLAELGETAPLEVAVGTVTPQAVAPVAQQALRENAAVATQSPPVPQVTVNVNTPAPANTVVVMNTGDGSPGFLVRMVWFLCIGWWLSFIWISFAWFLNLTLIGLPLGLMMINRVPKVLTLQGDKKRITVTQQGGVTLIQQTNIAQLPMWIRALYFLFIGWWASLLFAYLGWALSILILTLPIGLLMFNFLPQVTTLRRN